MDTVPSRRGGFPETKGRVGLAERWLLLGWNKGAAVSPLWLLQPWLGPGVGRPGGPVGSSTLFLEVAGTEGKAHALTDSLFCSRACVALSRVWSFWA